MMKRVTLLDAYYEDRERRRIRPGTESCMKELYHSLDIPYPDRRLELYLRKFGLALSATPPPPASPVSSSSAEGYRQAVAELFPTAPAGSGWEQFGKIPPEWQRKHVPINPSLVEVTRASVGIANARAASIQCHKTVKASLVKMKRVEEDAKASTMDELMDCMSMI
jgi:hypothetical protein